MALPNPPVPSTLESLFANLGSANRLTCILEQLMAMNAGIPVGAASVDASSGNVANAQAAAAMPAVAAKTNYITGFEITGSGSTAGLPTTVTVTGILGGTLSYTYTFAAGVLVPNQPLVVEFPVAIPASAVNTAITVTCPAGGAGNTNNTANVHGFVL